MENNNLPFVVAYGGGTNSVAMLCGFRDLGIKPSLIVFADTGGELPYTYDHIKMMSCKTKEWWGLEIETVVATYKGQPETLEDSCLRKKVLPSLAYGFKACSLKHKVDPQNKRLKQWMKDNGINQITRCIGYDAGEGHRKVDSEYKQLTKNLSERYWYPLIDWKWRRQECIETIKRHGIPLPGKSSCFFCPAMKFGEIFRLKQEHPEYFNRAIQLERNLQVKDRVRGLNFGVPWYEIVESDEKQLKMFEFFDELDNTRPNAHIPCGCYDG